MVIIDAHCHLSEHKGNGPASQLLEGMNVAGIDIAIVFGDNDFVSRSSKEYPDRFIPFYYFNPRNEDVQLEEFESYARDRRWKGVKVGHELAVARFMYQMMEIAEKYELIYVHHSGGGNEHHPFIIGDLANSFPKVRTVLLHMGGGMSLDLELASTKVAEKNPNVYLETCYAHPYAIKQAVERLGADRVMFGSDASNNGYGSYYEKRGQYQNIHLDAVRLIGLPRDQEEMVLGGTAARLLGIET
jgi:predicted TIM-barrel fold metal-dependent hydrolase